MPDFSFQGIKDAIGLLLGQSSGEDAVSMLIDDHKRVKEIFDTFKNLDDDEKLDAKHKALVELALHAAVEEKLVYPLLREEDEDDEVNEAIVEHHVMKVLMVELEAMKEADAMLDAKFKVLGEIVEHHVKEEESDLFPKLRSSDNNLQELGAEIKSKKEELLSQLGDGDDLGKIDPELSPAAAPRERYFEDYSSGTNGHDKEISRADNKRPTARKSTVAKKLKSSAPSERKQASDSEKNGGASKPKAKKAAVKTTAKKSSSPAKRKKVRTKAAASKSTTRSKTVKTKPETKTASSANASKKRATSASSKAASKTTVKAKKPVAVTRKAAGAKKTKRKSK